MNYDSIINRLCEGLDNTVSLDWWNHQGENGDRWNYVPFSNTTFIDYLNIAVKHWQSELRNLKLPLNNCKFVDCGAGIGVKPLIASAFGLDAYGVEISEDLVKRCKKINKRIVKNIIQQDVLEHDYGKYHIIYFYCPLRNPKLQAEFEKRILDTCKKNAIIIAIMHSNRVFNTDLNSNLKALKNCSIFQKVS